MTILHNSELGTRYNNGKLRLDLIPGTSIKSIGKVLTFGALKYDDRNWEKGLSWSDTIASLKRHLLAIEEGLDYDEESGLLHIEHVLTNALFLNHFYQTFPEGDDRPKTWQHPKRIGLDIDGVLADFVGQLIKLGVLKDRPSNWNFSNHIDWLAAIDLDPELFWSTLEPVEKNLLFTFEPVCYITKRYKCDKEWILNWLMKCKFPVAPIEIISYEQSKVDIAKNYQLNYFVDDSFVNFCELNNAGITCFLMSASHNLKNNVGHLRIERLQDLCNIKHLF